MKVLADIDNAWLRQHPLPAPPRHGDKERRGSVLVVGGSPGLAGAIVLSAIAALRAGAGKLTIATHLKCADSVGLAVPEARVIGLHSTGSWPGAEGAAGFDNEFDAVLVGPGLVDERPVREFARAMLGRCARAAFILDAGAINLVLDGAIPRGAKVLITPHAGELAHLGLGAKTSVQCDPSTHARAAAKRLRATVALKGDVTHIALPSGAVLRHMGGNCGLGTSGSGDVLAGLIAGLAARGSDLGRASAWGVALHARAGEILAARLGLLGYLARELAGEVPRLMDSLAICSREADLSLDDN